MGDTATVIDFDAAKSRRFLESLKSHPFLAVVITGDDEVCVFDKGIGPEEVARIRQAIEESLSERSEVGKQQEER